MKRNSKVRSTAMTTVTALMVTLLFTSCIKEGTDTMVLPFNDGRISPQVVNYDEQRNLSDNGFNIHEGIEPPNLEGVFLAAPLVLQYSSDNYRNAFYNLKFGFEQQFKRGMVNYTEQQRDSVEGNSTMAQIIGHDSCFTMYCTQYINEYSGPTLLWSCKTATVISGIITENGIKDFQYAFVMLEKEATSDYYYNMLAPIETIRIWSDNDNLASRLK